jgi:hypothetical protein
MNKEMSAELKKCESFTVARGLMTVLFTAVYTWVYQFGTGALNI